MRATLSNYLKYWSRSIGKEVAVGTAVTCRPPHRSVRAELPHTAPASGDAISKVCQTDTYH